MELQGWKIRARLFTEQFTGWDCLFTMGEALDLGDMTAAAE